MARSVRRILAALSIGCLFAVGAFAWAPTPAQGQDLDLCDLLGDPYCPDGAPGTAGSAITCSPSAAVGATGTCTVGNVEVGDSVIARLICGDYTATLFSGTATEVPFTFSFTVPSDAPVGSCTIEVAGATLPFTVLGSSTLARTGSDVGPLIGIGGGLLAVGVAAALGARRRLRTPTPV